MNNNKPQVTIIINCLNGEKYIPKVFETVFSQKYKNWQIIFCDNCSTDKTALLVQKIIKNDCRKIIYIKTPLQCSLGAARNYALSLVSTPFVCFLDCDDTWDKHFLEQAINAFSIYPDISLYYCNYWQVAGKKQVIHNSDQLSGFMQFKDILHHYNIAMSGCMFKTDLYKEKGFGFNNEYSLIEDYDFFLKLMYKNQAYYDSKPLLYYTMHINSLTYKNIDKWGDELKKEYEYLINDFLSEKDIKEYTKDLNWLYIRSINATVNSKLYKNKRLEALSLCLRNLKFSYKLLFPIIGVVFGYKAYTKCLQFILKNNYYAD